MTHIITGPLLQGFGMGLVVASLAAMVNLPWVSVGAFLGGLIIGAGMLLEAVREGSRFAADAGGTDR